MASEARRAAFASDEELMTREDASRLVRRLWALLGPYRRRIYLCLLLIAIWTACLLAGPALVKHGIDAGLTKKNEGALYLSAGLFLGVAITGLLFGRAAIWQVSKVGEPFLRDLRNRVFRHLMSLDLGFFEREQTGRLVARLTSDVDAMQDLVQIGLAQFAQNVFLFVGAVAPQQTHELVARMGPPRRQGKIGEQRACLLVGNIQHLPRCRPGLKTAKQIQPEARHKVPNRPALNPEAPSVSVRQLHLRIVHAKAGAHQQE